MTRTFILTIILTIGICIKSYSQSESDYLIQILNSKSVSIETKEVENALVSPPFWSLQCIFEKGELKYIDYQNGAWFGENNYFIESTSLLKKTGSLIGPYDYKLGVWNYNNQIKTLDIEDINEVISYKIIRLNPKELLLEDIDGCRYYFISQPSLSNAPINLQELLKYDLKVEDLRNEWSQIKADNHEKLYTIYSCEDFSEGLSLVRIDTEHKADEMNYGYGKMLYGFINKNGEYQIEPKYDKAFTFKNGFALVNLNTRKESNWEFINQNGKNLFNKSFLEARSYSEGFAAVAYYYSSFGFIDTTGVFITKPQYEEVGDYKDGFARVKFQGKWGFINKSGKEVIYPQFSYARDFSDGLALVGQFINNVYTQYSYIDTTGNISIKLGERDVPILEDGFSRKVKMEIPSSDFNNGLAIIKIDRLWGSHHYSEAVFINKKGNVVIKPKEKNCYGVLNFYQFINDFAIASCGEFWFLNKKGNSAFNLIFDDIGNFHEGLARVKINDNWGFINTSGNVIINPDILKSKTEIRTSAPYDDVSDFREGLAMVLTRNRIGYIDKTGKWVIQPELIAAKPFNDGIARVKLSNRKGWSFIDKDGKLLFTKFQ